MSASQMLLWATIIVFALFAFLFFLFSYILMGFFCFICHSVSVVRFGTNPKCTDNWHGLDFGAFINQKEGISYRFVLPLLSTSMRRIPMYGLSVCSEDGMTMWLHPVAPPASLGCLIRQQVVNYQEDII